MPPFSIGIATLDFDIREVGPSLSPQCPPSTTKPQSVQTIVWRLGKESIVLNFNSPCPTLARSSLAGYRTGNWPEVESEGKKKEKKGKRKNNKKIRKNNIKIIINDNIGWKI